MDTDSRSRGDTPDIRVKYIIKTFMVLKLTIVVGTVTVVEEAVYLWTEQDQQHPCTRARGTEVVAMAITMMKDCMDLFFLN